MFIPSEYTLKRNSEKERIDSSKFVKFVFSDGTMIFDWFDGSIPCSQIYDYLSAEGYPLGRNEVLVAKLHNVSDGRKLTKVIPRDQTTLRLCVLDHNVDLYVKTQ